MANGEPWNDTLLMRIVPAFDGHINLPNGEKVFDVVTGSDWQTRGPSDVMGINARVSAVSEDGKENLDLEYYGKIKITQQIENVIAARGETGAGTEWGGGYYFITPRIHSRSERWAWVNDAVFLACGKLTLSRKDDGSSVSTVSYRIYKVE
ncbi:hypothetical protein H2202_010823 [Exophiala xenobiotica]|nr:hypothetical protein H2202_010823 [Exophiala xenobiotica]KAK5188888.1 hypothetical protein LTR92_011102 [Exophiala xenobiotica]KAK5202822.1 hypothetical protein LTR41_011452 [Exophiala xenobiotica]KAK5215708.1 hypothetical protein LTR72_011262 [Exophiala xenobiotica]KAK5221566.1 hypothetical protein LTR47_010855 [Exophiala xenobiotica]